MKYENMGHAGFGGICVSTVHTMESISLIPTVHTVESISPLPTPFTWHRASLRLSTVHTAESIYRLPAIHITESISPIPHHSHHGEHLSLPYQFHCGGHLSPFPDHLQVTSGIRNFFPRGNHVGRVLECRLSLHGQGCSQTTAPKCSWHLGAGQLVLLFGGN